MQWNGYRLNVINKTIKNTLQNHNSEHKSKELEPLKMFIPYEKGLAKGCKQIWVYNSLYKSNRLKRTITNKTKGQNGNFRCSL